VRLDSDVISEDDYISSNPVFQIDHGLLRDVILTVATTIGNHYYKGADRFDD